MDWRETFPIQNPQKSHFFVHTSKLFPIPPSCITLTGIVKQCSFFRDEKQTLYNFPHIYKKTPQINYISLFSVHFCAKTSPPPPGEAEGEPPSINGSEHTYSHRCTSSAPNMCTEIQQIIIIISYI